MFTSGSTLQLIGLPIRNNPEFKAFKVSASYEKSTSSQEFRIPIFVIPVKKPELGIYHLSIHMIFEGFDFCFPQACKM